LVYPFIVVMSEKFFKILNGYWNGLIDLLPNKKS